MFPVAADFASVSCFNCFCVLVLAFTFGALGGGALHVCFVGVLGQIRELTSKKKE